MDHKQKTISGAGQGGGSFGNWIWDQWGLPAYDYQCDQDRDPKAFAFTTRGPGNLHWHQIGNERITAIASNRGEIQALESDRGLEWINYYDPDRICPGGGIAVIVEGDRSQNDLYSPEKLRAGYSRIFGAGYFRKTAGLGGIETDHLIYPPPGDYPVILTSLAISNHGDAARNFLAMEYFGINLHYMIPSLLFCAPKRFAYNPNPYINGLMRAQCWIRSELGLDSESKRKSFSKRFQFRGRWVEQGEFAVHVPEYTGAAKNSDRNRRSPKNYYPPCLFLCCLNAETDVVVLEAAEALGGKREFPVFNIASDSRTTNGPVSDPALGLGTRITLKPGEKRTLAFAFGFGPEEDMPGLARRCRREWETGALGPDACMKKIKSLIVDLSFDAQETESGQWLRREAFWHSSYVLGAGLYDEYYETHYLPQGGAYEFLHGLRGTIRDLMIFSIPLCILAPDLARQLVEYCMRQSRPDGRINYAATGFGQTTGAIFHERPSDQQLFLLWGLTEYIFATGDFEFLDKDIPFYPKDMGSSTVKERIKLYLRCLFDTVGFGGHGLLRVMDGDWNDGISLFAGNRKAFVRRGESVFNSAMALYVLPRAAALLDMIEEPQSAAEAREKADKLSAACMESWNGKWFFRGWDGRGNPIGDEAMFLEHQSWLLLSGFLPRNISEQLAQSIYKVLDAPSAFGQYIFHPPIKTNFNFYEPGWDVNGGIWFAVNFILAWAYSRWDREKAWSALRKNSLAHKAAVYPDIWYGIWSGPDAINADYASRPGETYFHIPTPSTDFPVMNLNLHAGFLLALFKLMGLEWVPGGLNVNLSLPEDDFTLKTPVMSLSLKNGSLEFSYQREGSDPFFVAVKPPSRLKGAGFRIDKKSESLESLELKGEEIIIRFAPGKSLKSFSGRFGK